MNQDFADIHDELRSVARRLLGKVGSLGGVDWHVLAESGLLGLEVPEALNGGAATFAEVAVILEEMGRSAAVSPYLATVVLGVYVLDLLEPDSRRDELLRGVASGEVRIAVALATGDDELPPFRLERSGDGLVVRGTAAFVPDAADVDRLLLVALDPDSEPVIVHAQPGPRLRVAAQPVVDASRRFGVVTADGFEVSTTSVSRFGADPAACARRLLDRAAVAIACDSLGLSEAMLDATVAYVGVRQQFGRPIGSFQAVKHACADMLVQISVARELLSAAVQSVVGEESRAPRAAAMAKSYVCGAAVDIVGKAMQLHGGIGYTWDSGIHVYLKRAALNRSLFGSPMTHRKRLAAAYM